MYRYSLTISRAAKKGEFEKELIYLQLHKVRRDSDKLIAVNFSAHRYEPKLMIILVQRYITNFLFWKKKILRGSKTRLPFQKILSPKYSLYIF